ncbi:MAG TPA: hypothetical protein DEA08_36735 [Planctomycetes bacterium]|nr:hypothetical protein [Planctomycetota bacterium]
MTLTRIRRSLTLIELTIVLLVLAAVAGILVPRLTGYTGKAHGSAGAANVQEISKSIALFEANNGSMPSGWDNLINDGDNTVANFLVDAAATNPFAPTALTATTAASLVEAGITTIHNLDNAADNKTFNPYAAAGTINLTAASTDEVATLTAAAQTSLGLPTATYAVFGLGARSTMINNVITDAPVHFPEGGENPENVYLRFVVIYNVDGEKARYVGVYALEPDSGELKSVGAHLAEFYENRQG